MNMHKGEGVLMNQFKLEEIIENADKVLIGIGEEFSLMERELDGMEIFREFKKYSNKDADKISNFETEWILPYILKMADKEGITEKIRAAYRKLVNLVGSKDYFVISTNMEDTILDVGFDEDRIVMPCGNYKNYKCVCNCQNAIWRADDIEEIISQMKSATFQKIDRPRCIYCGGNAEFNTILSDGYLEEGYAKQWKKYTDWIQGTLNKKLCILELGVAMDYPTVIRWPFEKMAFYNQKSVFIRVNERMPFMPDEVREKGISIQENSINFLGN